MRGRRIIAGAVLLGLKEGLVLSALAICTILTIEDLGWSTSWSVWGAVMIADTIGASVERYRSAVEQRRT